MDPPRIHRGGGKKGKKSKKGGEGGAQAKQQQQQQAKQAKQQHKKNKRPRAGDGTQAAGRTAPKRARSGGEGPAAGAGSRAPTREAKKARGTLDKLKDKLESGQFRWLNEQLYSTSSKEALALFKRDRSLYDVYHRGFETQVSKWPENPVRVVARLVKKLPADAVVGDFGCGNAYIARTVPQKVHSFDLCETNEWVTVANSADVPLADKTLDAAVFCLSLMGTDFDRFLLEARRTLKDDGLLIIAEVKSRFSGGDGSGGGGGSSGQDAKHAEMMSGIRNFKTLLRAAGFKLQAEQLDNKMFVLMQFRKRALDAAEERRLPGKVAEARDGAAILKSCKYKRR